MVDGVHSVTVVQVVREDHDLICDKDPHLDTCRDSQSVGIPLPRLDRVHNNHDCELDYSLKADNEGPDQDHPVELVFLAASNEQDEIVYEQA